MYRYTTPTLPVRITGFDYSDVDVFRIKLKQEKSNVSILKEVEADDSHVDAENNKVYVPLTQEETASFKKGNVSIQARIKFNNGAVEATNEISLTVKQVLDEVII